MGGRSEAPFAMAFLHRFPLVVDVQRKRAGNAFAAHQFRAAGDDKPEAGHALDTFVGAANQEVDAEFVHVQGDAAKAAHTVYNQFFTMHFDYMSEFTDRIQNAGGRFAVYEGNVGDVGIIAQVIVYVFYGNLFCFFKGEHIIV